MREPGHTDGKEVNKVKTRFEFKSRVVFKADDEKLAALYAAYLEAKSNLRHYLSQEGLDAEIVIGEADDGGRIPVEATIPPGLGE